MILASKFIRNKSYCQRVAEPWQRNARNVYDCDRRKNSPGSPRRSRAADSGVPEYFEIIDAIMDKTLPLCQVFANIVAYS